MAEDLHKKLTELVRTGDFKDGAMHLGPSGHPAAMNLVLSAIDNTILPRLVTFSVADMSVTLNVGGRRLRALVGAAGGLDAPQDVLDQVLSSADTAALAQIGDLLKSLTAQPGPLKMVRADISSSSGQSDAGVGTATLAQQWDVDPDLLPPTKLAACIAQIKPHVIASVDIVDGQPVNPQGDASIAAQLDAPMQAKLEHVAQNLSSTTMAMPGAHLAVLDGLLADDMLTCAIQLDGQSAMLALTPDAMAHVASAWSRA